jgi:hypothetical protein
MTRTTRLFTVVSSLGLLAVAFATPARAASPTSDNTDTGIRATQCYASGSDALVACSQADLPRQDGQTGRDTDLEANLPADGTLGFSFAKVCNSGQQAGAGTCPANPALGAGPDDWACVVDTVTQVMYEVKTTSGLRGRSHLYTNYSAQYNPVGQYATATDAQGYINRVNLAMLCGHNDWKLNHAGKVQSIVDYGQAAPAKPRVDPVFFVNVVPDWYWSNSPNPSAPPNTAFGIHLGTGEISNAADRSTQRHVLAVRNAFLDTSARFTISPDGTQVADAAAHAALVWRRCVEGMSWDGGTCTGTPLTFTHEEALAWAAQQASATGLPWRVPSVKELDGLVRRTLPSPPTYLFDFPATPALPTWTSSPEVRQPGLAWVENFSVGLVETHARSEHLVLRLARDPGPF